MTFAQWFSDNASWVVPTAIVAGSHVRTLLPPQAQGVIGLALKVADIAFANYGAAKNQPADKQGDAPVDKPAP